MYQDKLAQGRSTSNFKAFRKSNLPPRMFNKEFTSDSDKVKEDFFAKFFYSVHSKSSSFEFSRDWSAGMPVLQEVSIEKKEAMKICKNLNVNISKDQMNYHLFCFTNSVFFYPLLLHRSIKKFCKSAIIQKNGKLQQCLLSIKRTTNAMYQITAQCLFYRSLPKFFSGFCSFGYTTTIHYFYTAHSLDLEVIDRQLLNC